MAMAIFMFVCFSVLGLLLWAMLQPAATTESIERKARQKEKRGQKHDQDESSGEQAQ